MSSSKKSPSKLLAPPCPSTPALELVNRYQILGTIPKPTYTSVLASSQSQMTSFANPLQPYPSQSPRSDYILKPHFTNLFFIEPVHKNIKDPCALANFFFPQGWHFIPMHPDKSIGFYKDILLKHQSVVFKPIFDKRDPDLQDQVTYFSTKYKVTEHYSHFPSLLLFMAKYKVPWIFKWQYNIANHIVIRQHFVKWWDAFKHPRIIEQVKLEFPVLVPSPVKQVAPSSSVIAPASVKSSYSTAQLDCPSTSNKSSKSKTKSSKTKSTTQDNTELLRVANLLLAQVQAQAQSKVKEESSSSNSTTAQSAQSESPDPYGSQAQDAQDPFA
ncbi:hypothetical protein Acr_27g0009270 [Actinidia rufa]|uniref:Uncharacterized protein n=1 Tax=Actinidia rufa TaxID=165716 RepID=A0A7J0H832_9ERIC|nr:hypothetical protein Acr_27g0009270 [Actinidia rufa]